MLAISETLAGDDRRRLLERYGRLLGSLRGTFQTGVDLGTTPEDMSIIGEETIAQAGGLARTLAPKNDEIYRVATRADRCRRQLLLGRGVEDANSVRIVIGEEQLIGRRIVRDRVHLGEGHVELWAEARPVRSGEGL